VLAELLANNPAARVKRQVCRGQEGTTTPLPSRLCATAAPARPTGRSRGETLALRWSDVDLTNSILRVRGTLSRANGHLVISEPKTERSPRDVPLSPATVALLGGSRRAKR